MSTNKADMALGGGRTARLQHASPNAESTTSKTVKTIGGPREPGLQHASPNAEATNDGAAITQRLVTMNMHTKVGRSQTQAEQEARRKIQNHYATSSQGSILRSKGSNITECSDRSEDDDTTPGAVHIGPHGLPVAPKEERSDDNLGSGSRHAASTGAAGTAAVHVVPVGDVERIYPDEQQRQDNDEGAQYRTTSRQQPSVLATVTEQSNSVNIIPPVGVQMHREGHLDEKYMERDPLMCCCINCDCCRHCCPKCASLETTREKVRCCVCCSMCCFMPVWLCGIDM